MSTSTKICVGNKYFWVDAAAAAEIERLAVTDQAAALALARRSAANGGPYMPLPDGGRVVVPMMLMDCAPGSVSPPVRHATPSLFPPAQGPNPMTTSPTHTKTAVGDEMLYADARVVAELERLRGENAALKALRDGAVLPPAAQHGTTPPATAHLSDREFWRAYQDAKNDPATPYGSYRRYLETAYRDGR